MTVTVKGIDHAIRTIQRYADMDAKLEEVVRRLCDVGEPIIRAAHGSGNRVWSEPFEGGRKIVAEGESVLFIEFGTGDAAGREAEKYDAVPSIVRPGSWSEEHTQQYSTLGFWFFGGQKYTETPPHPAFYEAYQAMVEALPQIVEEVFKQ